MSRELTAALPWFAAGFMWFAVVVPFRASQETGLADQAQVRRERARADRALRASEAQKGRIATNLASACRASAAPADFRQRVVAATSQLELSPFSLSVTSDGAAIETSGSRSTLFTLLARLGDPARGTYLRTISIRDRGGDTALSVSVALFAAAPGTILGSVPDCGAPVEPPPQAPDRAPEGPVKIRPPAAGRPTPMPPPQPSTSLPPPPPFSLVGLLVADGKPRVSVRVGDQIKVLSVGDDVLGWRCVSIDPHEGATFVSSAGEKIVLKSGS